jgi:hypothetical protein
MEANYLSDGISTVPDLLTILAEPKMFKITGCIILGSILCAVQAATGPPALALDRVVELTNTTRMAIVEIYVSQIGTGRWDLDLLGPDILAPSRSLSVTIDDGAGCRFDVKTVFDDGTIMIQRNVNVCGEKYAISYR